MKHRLEPLLRPRSIAIVGASEREDSMGEWALVNLERGEFPGKIYPVNPGYDEVRGLKCYPKLADIPESVDLCVFAVGDHRIEQPLDAAIARNIPAAVIMSSLCLDEDEEPPLKHRVQAKILAANMLVCGANGMGFYNVRDNTWACGFDSTLHKAPGNASLISHSGSGMCGIIDCDRRLRINFAVSTGNELSVTMDEYLDFVLDLPETKVVGLFIETARNPVGFRAALAKAVNKQIPIVALKVGRSRTSAELAVSHSGAIAGDDAAYDALFVRYGVHRVRDMDELATAMILFAELNPLGPGDLVTLHDSGGERQLIVDLADDARVPLTDLSAESKRQLEKVLAPELPAVNPLDAWSRGGDAASRQMSDCFSILMQDKNAAIGALIHDRAPDGVIYRSYIRYMEEARESSGKPVVLVASRQGTGSDPLVVETTHRGLPVLDGVTTFLSGVRGMMNYRDFLALPQMRSKESSANAVEKWTSQLANKPLLDEFESLAMLRDFDIATNRCGRAETEESLLTTAQDLTWPLVLKTATPGIQHKSEHRGVLLNLQSPDVLKLAYRDLRDRLGPRVLVAEMAPEGIEMFLGARRDAQFGPVVLLGFGGVQAEVLNDVTFALPPFDAAFAKRRIATLRLAPLLDGVRGKPAVVIEEFCNMAAKFSSMVYSVRDQIMELDINPVIVSEKECVAVDALVVGRNMGEKT